jgi:aldose 1-epimerase
MAPWPNRIRDGRLVAPDGEHPLPLNSGVHAIHGLVRDREWKVVERAPGRVTLRIELQWPWPYRGAVISTTEVSGPAIQQTLAIEAAPGEREFPAGFGWHPWFKRSLNGGEVSLQADAEAAWVLDPTVTPTGEVERPPIVGRLHRGSRLAAGSLDGCFRMERSRRAVLSWHGVTLTITSSPNVSHLMVYTPKDGTALCVEPQTCTVNAFQLAARGISGTGTATVAPGRPLIGWTRWSWG